MPTQTDVESEPVPVGLECGECDGAVGVERIGLHRLVDPLQYGVRFPHVHRCRPCRVPSRRRDRGRLDALATHVPDQDPPPTVGDLEHVVEVAADAQPDALGPVVGVQLEPLDSGSVAGSRLRWRTSEMRRCSASSSRRRSLARSTAASASRSAPQVDDEHDPLEGSVLSVAPPIMTGTRDPSVCKYSF